MKARLLPHDPYYFDIIRVTLNNQGKLTLVIQDMKTLPLGSWDVISEAIVCEPFNGVFSTDVTEYAVAGVQSLQSCLRGLSEQVIPETILTPFCIHAVEFSQEPTRVPLDSIQLPYDGLFAPLYRILKKRRKAYVYSQDELLKVTEDEAVWEAVFTIPVKEHPADKGFTAYCTSCIGEDLAEVKA